MARHAKRKRGTACLFSFKFYGLSAELPIGQRAS
jgi:hypothetical protein